VFPHVGIGGIREAVISSPKYQLAQVFSKPMASLLRPRISISYTCRCWRMITGSAITSGARRLIADERMGLDRGN